MTRRHKRLRAPHWLAVIPWLILPAMAGWATPPGTMLTRTLEAVSIQVRDKGSLLAVLDNCRDCQPIRLSYGRETVFINGLGQRRPADEISRWHGSTALVRYRLADDAVVLVDIRR